jgi:hypothetical protein
MQTLKYCFLNLLLFIDGILLIITCPRVTSQRVDKPAFFPLRIHDDTPMSWDRVIQDSDEDEPLIEEDISTSIDPLQGHDLLVQQQHDHGADQQSHYPIERQDASTEPQLSVNFDQFLQSQEAPHASLNSSQQRREERWIPSTGEGGGGSIGACGQTDLGV